MSSHEIQKTTSPNFPAGEKNALKKKSIRNFWSIGINHASGKEMLCMDTLCKNKHTEVFYFLLINDRDAKFL